MLLLPAIQPLDWIGAAIAAGASIIGGAMSANAQGSSSWDKQVYADQKVREDSAMQRRVADAEKAGLHPLFALGTGASTGAGVKFGGDSGSALGEGIAGAGRAVAKGIDKHEYNQRMRRNDDQSAALQIAQVRNLNSRSDWVDQQAADSKAKVAEQDVWGTGNFRGGPDATQGVTGQETRTIPPKVQTRTAEERPTVMHANLSFPEFIELVGQGEARMMGLNPDAGMDEIGQAYYVYKKLMAQMKPSSVGDRKRFTSYWSQKTTGRAKAHKRMGQIHYQVMKAVKQRRINRTLKRWNAPPRRHP